MLTTEQITAHYDSEDSYYIQRTELAKSAMQGLLAGSQNTAMLDIKQLAEKAYKIADAMINVQIGVTE